MMDYGSPYLDHWRYACAAVALGWTSIRFLGYQETLALVGQPPGDKTYRCVKGNEAVEMLVALTSK